MAVGGLFRCQIVGRTKNLFVEFASESCTLIVFIAWPRQSKIEYFDNSVSVEDQVRRLDVAVHKSFLVRIVEPKRCLTNVICGISDIDRAFSFYLLMEIASLNIFHHDVMNVADCP